MRRIELRIGDIPPRTMVNVSTHILDIINAPDEDIVIDNPDLEYTCMDCKYFTTNFDEMAEHQENQKQYHSLW